ncbi:ABC transporter ATP-binding protein [Spirosoma sp. KUDC1026]|uniref:ABC transporter ATP-binding protein n=1 Tax=Spirosoma sp. KUDC1026 TaxID=2745947 RepID=UPI00159BBB3F|nr:ABC transporter ATP-binding protein [Spirosoma sp. KUDC1026]QKZ14815.1 ABC transporter ATP-binding protein [Spirosoma sp. KUDC1026]
MLTVTNLTKTFNEVAAVRDVSFTLEPGRVMALVGASGSGKSTLLSLLAGLLDADGGDVRVDGERVPGPSEKLIPGHPAIRLVHQEYQLMPNVSIRENISYALRFFERTYRDFRTDELLRLCRLTGVKDRLPRQVSGGEKQRTAIARAIADKPAILLLDEPFSHLDLPNRLMVRELLFELIQQEKTACLFVTHDASDALSIADTLGILQDGELIQLDEPRTVYRQPATAYAAGLTGLVNILTAEQVSRLGLSVREAGNTLYVLRPERIQLRDDSPVTGLIQAIFFKGSHVEVEINIGETTSLRAITTNDDLVVGQPIGLVVDEKSLWPVRS